MTDPDLETSFRWSSSYGHRGIVWHEQTTLKNDLIAAVKNGTVRSMCDGQRFAMRHFVGQVARKRNRCATAR